jgi:hypothetical protein
MISPVRPFDGSGRRASEWATGISRRLGGVAQKARRASHRFEPFAGAEPLPMAQAA